MTTITRALVLNNVGPSLARRKNEKDDDYLSRVVSLNLSSKKIENIDCMNLVPSLKVLNLRNNEVGDIDNLTLPNLTHLDLQYNYIQDIVGLRNMPSLTHLYLNYNLIVHIGSFEGPHNLEELHISGQRYDLLTNEAGEPIKDHPIMQFYPQMLIPIAHSLLVLNIAKDKLKDISAFSICRRLRVIDASNNEIDDLKVIEAILHGCPSLQELKLEGNPICSRPKFFEDVVAMSDSLKTLNGKEIIPTQREFIKRLKARAGTTHPAKLPPASSLPANQPAARYPYPFGLPEPAGHSFHKYSVKKIAHDMNVASLHAGAGAEAGYSSVTPSASPLSPLNPSSSSSLSSPSSSTVTASSRKSSPSSSSKLELGVVGTSVSSLPSLDKDRKSKK